MKNQAIALSRLRLFSFQDVSFETGYFPYGSPDKKVAKLFPWLKKSEYFLGKKSIFASTEIFLVAEDWLNQDLLSGVKLNFLQCSYIQAF